MREGESLKPSAVAVGGKLGIHSMKFFRRIRTLVYKRRRDAEMTAEMRLHLELQTERNLAAGMNAEEARYAALREFGGVEQIKERCRDARPGLWMDHLTRDLRHAWRTLAKAPFVSLVIVGSLAIGIGVNAVIFSWIRGLVFRPIPAVANAAHLQLVEPRTENGSYPGSSWQEYRDLQERLTAFQELVAFRMLPLNFGEPGKATRVYAQMVSGNYFSALGLRSALGRALRADDAERSGGAAVAVVSYSFWQDKLGGSDAVLGRTVRLNEQLFTIVGVAPKDFYGTVVGLSFDIWLPATMAPVVLSGSQELESRETRGYSVGGFLREGASKSQAQTELDTAMAELAQHFPETNTGVRGEILPFWRAPRGAPRFVFNALAAMQGFMLLVLLAVCANAANLLLARATARQREIGVRLALGARPAQILRLFLVESLVLGMAAAALGALVAWWGSDALRAVPLPGNFPFKFQTELDAVGLVFVATLGLMAALAFGIGPAVQSARTDSQLALRAGRGGHGRKRARSTLVALEAALAVLVLIVAAMFMRNLWESRTGNPGFEPEGVLLAGYDLTSGGYDNATGTARMDEVLRRLRALPTVEAAAIATWAPLDFHSMPQAAFKLDAHTRTDGGMDRALTTTISAGYFQAMAIPFIAGHDFAELGDRSAPPQAIVNEQFVRQFLEGQPALGHRIAGKNAPIEIVGVVRDSLYENFGERPKPVLYLSLRDRFALAAQIFVRARSGAESTLAPDLRRVAREIDPAISIYDVRTLSEHVDKNLFFRRIPARLFAGLGPLVLLLAAIGIYAVVGYAVAQRTSEIGVRLALGASRAQIVRQFVRENLLTVAAGIGPAWLFAVVVMLHMRGGVLSAPVLLGAPLLLFVVAAVSAWLPARRAARIDAMVALRCE